MVFINQNELLGSVIPDARISKITLETGGTILRSQNPHIEHALEGDISNKSEEGKILKATLNLMFKETLGDNLIGKWFNDEKIIQYVRARVIQVTDKALSETFALSSDFLEAATIGTGLASECGRRNRRALENQLSEEQRENFMELIQNGTTIKDVDLKSIIGDDTALTQHYTEVDNDGNSVTSLGLPITFELQNPNPEYLAYFVFTYLDVIEIAKDFGISLRDSFLTSPIGRIVSDVVFDDGTLVGRSFIFLDDEGKIWTGSIFRRDDEGNFFGQTADGEEIPLTRRLVGNSKVQDFRSFERLEQLILDFSITENEILRQQITDTRNQNWKSESLNPLATLSLPVLSDLYVARDADGDARFFFSLDMRKVLAQNSVYGKLFKQKEGTVFELLEDTEILSMRLFRRRIAGSPAAGSAPSIGRRVGLRLENRLFDRNQFDELFAQSGDSNPGEFVEVSNDNIAFREIRLLTSNNPGDTGVRHFTGIDKQFKLLTDGYYQYVVEIEIFDSAFKVLLNRGKTLQDARKFFEGYYQESIQLGTTSRQIANENPHIDFPGERAIFSEASPGNFDPAVNRFTQSFIDKMNEQYSEDVLTPPPWCRAVRTYLDMLNFFTDEELDVEQLGQFLLHTVHPATGNPTGIRSLLNLMEKLEKDLCLALDLCLNGPVADKTIGAQGFSFAKKSILESKVGFAEPVKTIKIRKVFSRILTSEFDEATGFDYLNVPGAEDLENGLKLISGQEYTDRIRRETESVFNSTEGRNIDVSIALDGENYTVDDVVNTTSFGYLTPAVFKMRDRFELKRVGSSPNPEIGTDTYANAAMCIRNHNLGLPMPKMSTRPNSSLPAEVQSTRKELLSFFAEAGICPTDPKSVTKVPVTNTKIPKDVSERGGLVIDPAQSEEVDFPLDPVVENSANFTPVLLELAKRVSIVQRAESLATNSVSFASNNSAAGNIRLADFDPQDPNSRLNRLFAQETTTSGFPAETISRRPEDSSEEEGRRSDVPRDVNGLIDLKRLPNQLKGLYLSRTNPEIVRKRWFEGDEDPLLTSVRELDFTLSTRMIDAVEVLIGWDLDENGNIDIKKPKWQELTFELYNQSVGGTLLCRLRAYQVPTLGIFRDTALELSTFDEYFFLRPIRVVTGFEDITAEAALIDPASTLERLNQRILQEDQTQMLIRTEFMTNQPVEEEEIDLERIQDLFLRNRE